MEEEGDDLPVGQRGNLPKILCKMELEEPHLCTEIIVRISQILHLISYQKTKRIRDNGGKLSRGCIAVAVLPVLDLAQKQKRWLPSPAMDKMAEHFQTP